MTQTLISAGTYLAAKSALGELPPMALVMLRTGGASLCFILIGALFVRPVLPARSGWWRVAALGLLGVPLNQGLFLSGLASTTPAHAALLYTLTPLFVFLLALVAGTEKPVPAKVLGLFIALGGAAIVVFERTGADLGGGSLLGDLLIFGAVIAWAGYTVMGKPLVAQYGPVAATVWSMTIGTAMFAPVGVPRAMTVSYERLSPVVWGSIAFLVLLTSVVSYLCWYYALRELEASRVAVFANLQPVTTALASWLVFGDVISSRLLLGGVLVICGVFVTTQAATWRWGTASPAVE